MEKKRQPRAKKKPVPKERRIQTFEGWKRSMMARFGKKRIVLRNLFQKRL